MKNWREMERKALCTYLLKLYGRALCSYFADDRYTYVRIKIGIRGGMNILNSTYR